MLVTNISPKLLLLFHPREVRQQPAGRSDIALVPYNHNSGFAIQFSFNLKICRALKQYVVLYVIRKEQGRLQNTVYTLEIAV